MQLKPKKPADRILAAFCQVFENAMGMNPTIMTNDSGSGIDKGNSGDGTFSAIQIET